MDPGATMQARPWEDNHPLAGEIGVAGGAQAIHRPAIVMAITIPAETPAASRSPGMAARGRDDRRDGRGDHGANGAGRERTRLRRVIPCQLRKLCGQGV